MYSTSIHNSPEYSSEHVARNSCYELVVDKSKNRIYFNILGFWKNKSAVPTLIEDWKKTLALMKSGFTILTDMRTMITHPQDLNELHVTVQKLIMDAGVKQVANVLPADKIANLQAIAIAATSTCPSQNFSSCEEAETWLNNLTTATVS